MLTYKRSLLAVAIILFTCTLGYSQIANVSFTTFDVTFVNHPVIFYYGTAIPDSADDGWLVHIIVDGAEDGIDPPVMTPGPDWGMPTDDDFLPTNNNFYSNVINTGIYGAQYAGGFTGWDALVVKDNISQPEPAANLDDWIYVRVFDSPDLPSAMWYVDAAATQQLPTGGGVYTLYWLDWGEDFQLPVEMLSFEAIAGNEKVKLIWITASEIDNKEFKLYRDGSYLATIPTQAEGGCSGGELIYEYLDEDLANGQEYTYSLKAVNINGNVTNFMSEVKVTPEVSGQLVENYALRQNYPNPFNPTTTIEVDVKETGIVTIDIYNITGQKISTLEPQFVIGGNSSPIVFDASDLPSGIYFYTVKVNNFSDVKKMVLLR